eukprot:m.134912 g.134912  ORF g.134912 m.134912 type:complete len:1743 (+) comp14855_c0_seq3:157-5385(+)
MAGKQLIELTDLNTIGETTTDDHHHHSPTPNDDKPPETLPNVSTETSNPFAQRFQQVWAKISRPPRAEKKEVEVFAGDALWVQENFKDQGFGTIPFPAGSNATYICVWAQPKKQAQASDLRRIGKNMVEALLHAGYSLPRLLISVTGGAKDFELSPQLETVLKRGLRRAALTTNAWIVSGGTDCGIMKYVGDAMAHIRGSTDEAARIPVIGIATLPKVRDPDSLQKGRGELLSAYASAESTRGVPLNPHHTHFFLVHTDINDYGQEVHVKNAFEEAINAEDKHLNAHTLLLRLPTRFVEAFGSLAGRAERDCLTAQLATALKIDRECVISLRVDSKSAISCVLRMVTKHTGPPPPVLTDESVIKAHLQDEQFRAVDGSPVSVIVSGDLPPKLITGPSCNGDRDIFSDATKTHSVVLVVEGGPVTLEVVQQAVHSRVPVVVIEGSGRAADLVALAWRYLHDTNRSGAAITPMQIIELLRDVIPRTEHDKTREEYEAKLRKQLTTLLEMVLIRHRVTIYSLASGTDIDDALLTAMLQAAQPRNATSEERFEDQFRKLHLSLLFQQPDRAGHHLIAMRQYVAESKELRSRYDRRVQEALLWAVTANLVKFVELFVPEVKDLGKFIFSKDNLVKLYQRGRASHFDALVKGVTGRTFETATDKKGGKTGASDAAYEDVTEEILNQIDDLAVKLLNPGLTNYRREKDFSKKLAGLPAITVRENAFHELLVWAVIMNRHDLAEFFWQSGGHSIANALICARLLKTMATVDVLQHRAPETAKGMQELAARFEHFALGVLGSCYEESVEKAVQLLRKPLTPFRWLRRIEDSSKHMNSIDLAYIAGARNFLGHTASQEVVIALWNGSLKPQSGGQIALLLFSLWRVPRKLNREATEKFQDHLCDDESQTPPLLQSLHIFFSAPVTKFILDAMCTIALIIIFCSIVLSALSPNTASAAEVVVALWMFGVLLERLRLMAVVGLRTWLQNVWNSFDTATCVLYIFAFAFRMHSLNTEQQRDLLVAKGLYALVLVLIFLGVCRLYAVSHNLGPKLIVVYKMLGNFLTFLAFYIVVMLAYGIAIQSLLFPTINADNISISSILYRPFFQLFGELMLDEMQSDGACVGFFPFTDCASMAILVVPLLAFYLIVSNIMLINLLIAMLSSTYARVEESSIELWRFQFHDLVEDYSNRAMLPGPLSIFENMFYLIKLVSTTRAWAAVRECIAPNSQPSNKGPSVVSTDGDTLEQFQERHTDIFLDEWRTQKKHALAAQINDMASEMSNMSLMSDQVDEILRRFDTIHTQRKADRSALSRDSSLPLLSATTNSLSSLPPAISGLPSSDLLNFSFSTPPPTPAAAAASVPGAGPMLSRLASAHAITRIEVGLSASVCEQLLGNKLARSASSYPNWDRALLSQSLDHLPTLTTATVGVYGCASPVKIRYALNAKKLLIVAMYENEPIPEIASTPRNHQTEIVKRAHLSDEQTLWTTRLDDYHPLYYVSANVLLFSKLAAGTSCKATAACAAGSCDCPFKWADCETQPVTTNPSFLNFMVVDGLPLNPHGRTGLRGRGALGKWGANPALDQIVTRWVRDHHGGIVHRAGKPLAQVLLIRRRVDHLWALPGSFVRPKDEPLPVLAKVFGVIKEKDEKDIPPDKRRESDRNRERFRAMSEFLFKGTSIYQGFMNDPRNTDNAWVETDAVHCHDDTDFLAGFPLLEPAYNDPADPVIDVAWATVHSNITLAFAHRALVELAASLVGAYW